MAELIKVLFGVEIVEDQSRAIKSKDKPLVRGWATRWLLPHEAELPGLIKLIRRKIYVDINNTFGMTP